jgi:hypothetical protein
LPRCSAGTFNIVEVNGAVPESTHIWDRRTALLEAWRALMRHCRWPFEMGHVNCARGFKTLRRAEFMRGYRRENC